MSFICVLVYILSDVMFSLTKKFINGLELKFSMKGENLFGKPIALLVMGFLMPICYEGDVRSLLSLGVL